MPINPIYPVVSDLLPLERIPSELEGLREALENVLGQVYFKDFRVGQSYHGEAAYYSLTLMSFNPLGLSIPFVQDLNLVVNPDSQGNTEIPVVLDYRWEILKYLNGFDFSSFNNGVSSIVDVLMELAGLTKSDMLGQVLGAFFQGPDALQDFLDAFNVAQGTSVAQDTNLPLSYRLTDVVNRFERGRLDLVDFLVNNYLTGSNFNESLENLNAVFSQWYGSITTDSINRLLKIKFRVLLPNLSVGLSFPRKWLVPVDAQLEPLPEPEVSLLNFNVGSLGYTSESGFFFQETNSFDLTTSMIGNTGLIIEFSGLKVDLEEDSNIPEADAYGYGPGFKGVYAQRASITLPKKWFDNSENNPNTTAQLAGYDILVGTGGFSGRLALEVIDGTSEPMLVKTVGNNGFEVGFSAFDINFDRNKVVSSNIAGRLKIPRLKDANGNIAEIDITGHLDSDSDFLLTASEKDGFAPIEIPNVLKLHIQGVELGREDGDFFIGTSAQIELTNPVMTKLLCSEAGEPLRISVPALRIYSDGRFEIVGGGLPLPTNFSLCLGPVKMGVTNLNYTSQQQEHNGVLREYKCWGFDGSISVNPLGVDVRGDGVRYCYTIDDDEANGRPHHSYIRISTIEVDIIIPGNASPSSATAIINGYVSIPEPGVSTEYAGGVSLKFPKIGVSGSVEMKIDPKYPAYILDANIEIPTPIPLAATGLGVFGFRGLLGFRYVAEKEAVGLESGKDSWYDYYVYPKRGINVRKFRTPGETSNHKNPISIGAGASIATYGSDDIINFRVFLLLSIPSLFFIEGKANILSERLGLDDFDEPPFFAFLAIGDSSIEAGLGADLSIPDNGSLLELYAKIEAGFFFKNPSAWYVNIGTKEEPITARLFQLLTVQMYLQLSGKGIEAGARAEFNFDETYAIVRVRAYAYIEVGGRISFERPQIGGYFAVGGAATVDVKIITVDIVLDLLMGAEASRPYLIYGKFRLCVKVKILFVKIRFCGEVEIKWEKSRVVDRTPIPPLPSAGLYGLPEHIKGVHMLTGDSFTVRQLKGDIATARWEPSVNNSAFNDALLPLDTYIDIKFDKPVNPNPVAAKTGGVNNAPVGNVELIPPQKTIKGKTVRQVKHAYSMEDIEIKAWNGSRWENYDPYLALNETAVESTVPAINRAALKIGHWQKPGKEYNALRLLGDSPFSFTQLGEPGWYVPEQVGITSKTLFCRTPELRPECGNWNTIPLGTAYVPDIGEGVSLGNAENFFSAGRLAFWVKAPLFVDNLVDVYNATVIEASNTFGTSRALEFYNFMSVELKVPNPSKQLTFKMDTVAEGVTFFMYRSVIDDSDFRPRYELVDTVYRTQAQLAQEWVYTADQSIGRVIVQPDFLAVEQINALHDQLEAINQQAFDDFIDSGGGETNSIGAIDETQEEALKQQIINLIQTGCTAQIPGGGLTGGIGQMQIGTSFQVGARDMVLEGITNYKSCTSTLYEVCWLSEVDYEFNLSIPGKDAIEADFGQAKDAVSKVIAPVWRPNTKYYIHLKLKDTVDGDTNSTAGEYHYYYGFQTAGPVGHFHNAPNVSYGGERDGNGKLISAEQYPLAQLKDYIDLQRSYPNADGNLLQAKPLFFGNQQAKILLFFKRPQTFHLLNDWPAVGGFANITGEMRILIKDPANDTLIPYPLPMDWDETVVPGGTESWEDDAQPLEPEYRKQLNNLIQAHHAGQSGQPETTCSATGGDRILPKTKVRTLVLTNLKPQKLYTALVDNIFDDVVARVHEFVFKTSRYANFTEQINSYLLDDGEGNTKPAIYRIPIDMSTALIDSTYNVIAGNADTVGDALADRFVDRFDRVVEGLWNRSPLPPPQTTEFNAVVDQNTGDTILLWIRNPEPFNDPKLPEAQLEASLNVLNNANDDPDNNYDILFSKDRAQALVMRNNKKITNTALRVRFKYLLWDGNDHAERDMVLVEGLNVTFEI